MSFWATAMVAANRAVAAPTQAIIPGAHPAASASSGLIRVSRYTPEVTMVAAWMSAETGVGPAMASGNHRYRGNWADLPTAPTKSITVTNVAVLRTSPPEATVSNTSRYSSEPTAKKRANMATMNPQSPMRLVMKAFLPAVALAGSENQKEISR